MLRSRVIGVGSYLPPRVVTNDDLAGMMDTSDEWIVQRTGIRERRWVEPDVATSDLALHASRAALEDAGIGPGDLDMIFVASLSPDHFFPGTACFLQAKLDVPAGVPAIDVRQQCSGFVYASAIADQFVRGGGARRVLVVGAEIHSKALDKTTEGRDVTVIFGDGAGAMVLEATEVAGAADPHVLSTHLHADGRFAEQLWVPAPGMALPGFIDHDLLDAGMHHPKMNGRVTYVHAVQRMAESVHETLAANGKSLEEIDLFLFHQANLRINEAVAKNLGIPAERVFNTIEWTGNTSAATIPIGMVEARAAGLLTPGDLVMGVVFGSGFTWASMLVRW
ncbi:MAG: ketoacyl-ACP synthase III [Acidimicrobiia bacterium]|nr:ketoacyl-ACP synthase III [Acidimicrobiia bacterium]